jgi:ABC-2 type transport system ATP-binding protein
MAPAIIVKDLSKRFGQNQVLKNLSFEVGEGEVFGLIGPNGAGKTTTLRTLSTLLHIDSGLVSILGRELPKQAGEVRQIISYLPEDAGAYRQMRGKEYLQFIAAFFAGKEKPAAIVKRGVEIACLDERINDKVETYSKGMMRRLLVARALMINPRLAILDEPSSGLDVINARQIRRIITDAARGGMTVLLSSHNMLEVELICQRVALINDGHIVAAGTPQELKSRYHAANIEEVFTQVVGCS